MKRALTCTAYGTTHATHPPTHRRLGYAYFSLEKGCAWFWTCLRCGAIWMADDLDREDTKIITVDPHLASLYGEPAV